MSLDSLASDVSRSSDDFANDTGTYLTFVIGPQIFAVDVHNVREILDMQVISGLPNAPHDVVGMIDVRNQGIAIVDIASRLGMVLEDETKGRIIVFEISGPAGRVPVGVIADKVLNVAEISMKDVESPPTTLSSWDPSIVQGVTRQDGSLVILLLLSEIFQADTTGDDIFAFGSSENALPA